MNEYRKQALKLIEKAKTLNDAELLEIALDLLEEKDKSIEKKPKPKENQINNFIMNPTVKNDSSKRQPVRENKFFDYGTEHKDLMGQTPAAQPKKKRAVNKKTVTCRVCKKKEKMLASLVMDEGEGYRCNTCILKGKYE